MVGGGGRVGVNGVPTGVYAVNAVASSVPRYARWRVRATPQVEVEGSWQRGVGEGIGGAAQTRAVRPEYENS